MSYVQKYTTKFLSNEGYDNHIMMLEKNGRMRTKLTCNLKDNVSKTEKKQGLKDNRKVKI